MAFDDCFMKFINIVPVYIRGWVEGALCRVGGDKGYNNEVRWHK